MQTFCAVWVHSSMLSKTTITTTTKCMRTGCNDGLWQRLSICKPLATLGSNYQQQHPQIWSKWVIMTAYGSVYLCKLFVPLWSILCRDHFHTKFLSLTSCSTYQACSSVKITQILHQNVGSQRRPWCFFQCFVFKASYTKLDWGKTTKGDPWKS